MSGETVTAPSSPRARRRAQTTAEILDAAWTLARRDGLAGISLRELGRLVGLRAQSLYGYFPSKAALYDAMFRQGQEQARELQHDWLDRLEAADDRRRVLREQTVAFARWCNEDPVRYQLLFQRPIPDWEPSAESYALAVAQLDVLRRGLALVGLTGDDVVDLYTALVTGLTSQQVSNEPGGERWIRLVPTAVDMFLDHVAPAGATTKEPER